MALIDAVEDWMMGATTAERVALLRGSVGDALKRARGDLEAEHVIEAVDRLAGFVASYEAQCECLEEVTT
jgi:hypothetical protein